MLLNKWTEYVIYSENKEYATHQQEEDKQFEEKLLQAISDLEASGGP